MSIRTTLIVLILLSLAGLGLSLWAAPNLPEMVPSHWNAAGQINGYAPRAQAVWMLPLMTLLVGLLLLFLPRIDPLRKNVEQFRPAYHWIIVTLAAFLLYMHIQTLLAGLGIAFNMTYTIIPAETVLMVVMGFVTERARPNWFIGIRTPWTLSSPTVWEKTHRLGGLTFKIAGVLSLIGLFFPNEAGLYFSLVPLTIAVLIPTIYSYLLYQAEQKH
jgi:uncharacterized membrane protein